MSTLIVFRHGKSDWGSHELSDHARPLKKRGRKAAQDMGRFLAAEGPLPDLVLSSSALRAHTSAELAIEAGAWNAPLRILDELYGASVSEILTLLRGLDEGAECLAVVGHEPSSSSLIACLTDSSVPTFPTAAMACIDLDCDWSSIEPATGSLRWLMTPRQLESDPERDSGDDAGEAPA